MSIIRVKYSDGTLYDAVQYNGSNAAECIEFCEGTLEDNEGILQMVDDACIIDEGDWFLKELTDEGEDAETEIQVYTNSEFEAHFIIVSTEKGE